MKNKGGRPTLMTKETIALLEIAYSNDATDLEACFIAEISPPTLYSYQEKHPAFIERKRALKAMIKYQAKSNIKKTIEMELGCDTSKWYLERKGKNEGFNSRTELTGADGKDLTMQNFLIQLDESETKTKGQEVEDK